MDTNRRRSGGGVGVGGAVLMLLDLAGGVVSMASVCQSL